MNKFKSKKYGKLYGGVVINWRKKKRLEKKCKLKLLVKEEDLTYPVVASPYAYHDMIVKEKVFTKDEVIAMLTNMQKKIMELPIHIISNNGPLIRMEIVPSAEDASELIQEEINALKENKGNE